MSVAEQTVTVIPDSITPYEGFKGVTLRDNGTIVSSRGVVEWAAGEPLGAECLTHHGYEWQPTQGIAQEPVEDGVDQWGNMLYRLGDTVIGSLLTPDKPQTELPPGWRWTYGLRECDHDPVHEWCTCGIYAASDIEGAAPYSRPHHNAAIIRVALWGKVIRGDKGARGQYAYPQEIITTNNPELARKAADLYGIPFTPVKPPPAVADEGLEERIGAIGRRIRRLRLIETTLLGVAITGNLALAAIHGADRVLLAGGFLAMGAAGFNCVNGWRNK